MSGALLKQKAVRSKRKVKHQMHINATYAC